MLHSIVAICGFGCLILSGAAEALGGSKAAGDRIMRGAGVLLLGAIYLKIGA